MSELEQKQKELTFEEICPEWSRRIANVTGLSRKSKLEIMEDLKHSTSCFIGEAHGFKGGIDCEECQKTHMGFNNGLCGPFMDYIEFGYSKFNWDDFNQRKDAFVKHWNEKHG